MNHQDAEIAEVVVIVSKAHADRLPDAVDRLKAIGFEVFSIEADESVVNGAIDTRRLPELKALEFVDYVRQVMTYIADYPAGDGRDMDGADDDADPSIVD